MPDLERSAKRLLLITIIAMAVWGLALVGLAVVLTCVSVE